MNRKSPNESQTDWARIDSMTDEDIDFSDIPRTTPEFWKNGFVRKGLKPVTKKSQDNVPIDKDIIQFFKFQNFNYPTRINEVLREIMVKDVPPSE